MIPSAAKAYNTINNRSIFSDENLKSKGHKRKHNQLPSDELTDKSKRCKVDDAMGGNETESDVIFLREERNRNGNAGKIDSVLFY